MNFPQALVVQVGEGRLASKPKVFPDLSFYYTSEPRVHIHTVLS